MNYWEECIREALEDAGLATTEEQVATLVGWVEGAHENYGMAHGYDAIPCPVESQDKRELEELRRHVEEHKSGWGRPYIVLRVGVQEIGGTPSAFFAMGREGLEDKR